MTSNMKLRYFLIPLLIILQIFIYVAYTSEENKKSEMPITEILIHKKDVRLGILEQNVTKQAVFKIKNVGSNALFIQDVETSCGCTVAEWTKKAIKPEDEAIINISYDAKNLGVFNKTIIVFANVLEFPIELHISGEVRRSNTCKLDILQ